MRVLILNPEGVLCITEGCLDPFLVNNFRSIVKYTDCKVVITGDWGLCLNHKKVACSCGGYLHTERLKRILATQCKAEVVGVTTDSPMSQKSKVELWISTYNLKRADDRETYPFIESFALLENASFNVKTEPNNWLIPVNGNIGLTKQDVIKTVRQLTGDEQWKNPDDSIDLELAEARQKGWLC